MNTKPINPILAAVAAELGATIQDPHNMGDRGEFTMLNGLQFYAVVGVRGTNNTTPDKINVSPRYPYHMNNANGDMRGTSFRDFPYEGINPGDINISAEKTPAQIARNIQTRFIKNYEPAYAAAVAFCQQQAAYYTGQRRMMELGRELFRFGGINQIHGDVKYCGANYVNVEISGLHADEMRAVAALIDQLNAKRKGA